MSPETERPQLVFLDGFDEREAFEAFSRGYRSHVFAIYSNGNKYELYFYDPIRLTQDLQASVECGIPYVAEPGMIVIPEVTLTNMQAAVDRLHAEGYFKSLRVTESEAANKAVNPSGGSGGL